MTLSDYYATFVIALSVVLGVICSLNSYQFIKARNTRAVEIRKPRLTLSYCLVGALPLLLIIAPLKTYLGEYWINHNDFTQSARFHFEWWLFSFLEEVFIACMLLVIVLRCWLLYYDHMYGISLIDRKWKGLINPHDQDFWMKHKKTLGDAGFLTLVGIVAINVLILILCVLSMDGFRSGQLTSLKAVNLFVIALPCCTFICGLGRYGKHTKIFSLEADKFKIIREMQYLSASTVFVVVTYIIDFADVFLHHRLSLITESANVLFTFTTCWIQTYWVVQHSHNAAGDLTAELSPHDQAELDRDRVQSTSVINMDPDISLMDVLRDKYGLTMFFRHCLTELSVEGLLFIVEVAQYKAKLVKDKKIACIPHTEKKIIGAHQSTENVVGQRNLPSLKRIKKKSEKAKQHKFEHTALCKNWIPAADHLFASSTLSLHDSGSTQSVSPSNEETKESEQTPPNQTPVPLTDDTQSTSSSDSANVDIAWMWDYANYLFIKYVDSEAEFTINVSFEVRHRLLLFFSTEIQEMFELVSEQRGIIRNEVDEAAYLVHVKDCLLHIFDDAVVEVWNLLSYSSFIRFRNTPQFKHLCEQFAKQ